MPQASLGFAENTNWLMEEAAVATRDGYVAEYSVALQPESRVDTANGVIRDVRIVGIDSRNTGRVLGLREQDFGKAVDQPYSYTMEALRNAIPLYEGCKVFVDHSDFDVNQHGQRVAKRGTRKSKDLIGRLQNVRAVEGEGLRGDFYYLVSDDLAPKLVEIAQRMPELMAMSHEAGFNSPKLQNGRIYLTEITDVDFVALVSTKPGTTNGLFEDYVPAETAMPETSVVVTLQQLAESVAEDTAGRDTLMEMCGHEMESQVPGQAAQPMGGLRLEMPQGQMGDQDKVRAGLIASINEMLANSDLSKLQAVVKAIGSGDEMQGASPTPAPPIHNALVPQSPPAPAAPPAPVVAPESAAAPPKPPEPKPPAPAQPPAPQAVQPPFPPQNPPFPPKAQEGDVPMPEPIVAVDVDPKVAVMECFMALRDAGVTDWNETTIKAMESLSSDERVGFARQLVKPKTLNFVPRSQSPKPREKTEQAKSRDYSQPGSLFEAYNDPSYGSGVDIVG